MSMRELVLDVETAYTIGAVWGMWEQDVAVVLQDEYILGVGYKYKHLDTVHWKGLPDFPLYKKEPKNDRELVKFMAELLQDCNLVIGHNVKQFDMKKIRARMFYHKLPPLADPKIFDTKTEVKKRFSYISNKLDDLSRQMLDEQKIKHSGIQLWTRCMDTKYDKKAWLEMGTYCKKDVDLTSRLHDVLSPWSDQNLNWNLDGDRPKCCPACGTVSFKQDGKKYFKSFTRQRYRCTRELCKHVWDGEIVPVSKI
mgnify:CR=1 FL=1